MGGSQSHVSDDERIQHLVEEAVRKEMEKRDLERKEEEEEEEEKVQENKEVKKEEREEKVGERQQDDLRFVSLTRNSSIIDTPSRSVFSPYALPNSGTHTWEFDIIRENPHDSDCRYLPNISLISEAKLMEIQSELGGGEEKKKEKEEDKQMEEWEWQDGGYSYYHRKEPLTVGLSELRDAIVKVKVKLYHMEKSDKLLEIFIDGRLLGGMDGCHKWQHSKEDSIGKTIYLSVKKKEKSSLRFTGYKFVAEE